jgi:hypothetical protein
LQRLIGRRTARGRLEDMGELARKVLLYPGD